MMSILWMVSRMSAFSFSSRTCWVESDWGEGGGRDGETEREGEGGGRDGKTERGGEGGRRDGETEREGEGGGRDGETEREGEESEKDETRGMCCVNVCLHTCTYFLYISCIIIIMSMFHWHLRQLI